MTFKHHAHKKEAIFIPTFALLRLLRLISGRN